MTANGNIIGKLNFTSTSSTVGVYDTLDQYTAKRVNAWPITIKYSSITVNSSTSALSLNEGSSITVAVATEGITSGTLYYSISSVGGTVNTSDFTDFALTGSFAITSNTGTFTKTLLADGTSEAGDAFQVQIRTGSTSGPIVLTSSTITINNPVFTLNMGVAAYNEGQSPQFQFSATNWNTQTLYWRSSNAADDNTSGLTQSTFPYTAGGAANFNPYTLKNDMITEGNETHTISIYDSTNVFLLASTTYTAIDTSLTPTVTESPFFINEGDSVTFTVTFPGGPTSGTIYWTTTGTMTANDFTDGVLSGTASISASGSNGVATITRTARRDYITDGAKSFGLNLYRDGVATTLVYTGSTTRISVADTVQAPTITPSSVSINEGDTVTFTVNTTGVVNGTVLPVTMVLVSSVSGFGNASDFTDNSLTTSVTITSNTGTFTRTWANDTFTEGTEVWKADLKYPAGDPLSGQTMISSANITVADTSTGTAEVSDYVPAVPTTNLYSHYDFSKLTDAVGTSYSTNGQVITNSSGTSIGAAAGTPPLSFVYSSGTNTPATILQTANGKKYLSLPAASQNTGGLLKSAADAFPNVTSAGYSCIAVWRYHTSGGSSWTVPPYRYMLLGFGSEFNGLMYFSNSGGNNELETITYSASNAFSSVSSPNRNAPTGIVIDMITVINNTATIRTTIGGSAATIYTVSQSTGVPVYSTTASSNRYLELGPTWYSTRPPMYLYEFAFYSAPLTLANLTSTFTTLYTKWS
jgi:hypothetical protein